jgi:mannose-6-phosphate isomerase-like protein (cupin superfamily)
MSQLFSFIPLLLSLTIPSSLFAQNELDPRPYDSSIDPDIDLFMNSWVTSIPFITHGSLTERIIFSKCDGDPVKPSRKGKVLVHLNRLSRVSLDPQAITSTTILKGEQELFYVISGKGNVTSGEKNNNIYSGAMFLAPEGLEFTITNTGDEMLVMYLVSEPVSEGYKPGKEILVSYEEKLPMRQQGYITTHWSHNGRQGVQGAVTSTSRVIFEPMTIGQPHSHGPEFEEIWLVTEGKNLAFLGKEIRWQYPGTAYKIPPSGFTPHANINTTEEPVRFLVLIASQPQ